MYKGVNFGIIANFHKIQIGKKKNIKKKYFWYFGVIFSQLCLVVIFEHWFSLVDFDVEFYGIK